MSKPHIQAMCITSPSSWTTNFIFYIAFRHMVQNKSKHYLQCLVATVCRNCGITANTCSIYNWLMYVTSTKWNIAVLLWERCINIMKCYEEWFIFTIAWEQLNLFIFPFIFCDTMELRTCTVFIFFFFFLSSRVCWHWFGNARTK